MSLLAMYRMVGLRNALLYLRDTLQDMLPLVRINAILCSPDGDMVISVADTSLINVSNKYKSEKRHSPLVCPHQLDENLIIGDLEPYKKITMQKHQGIADMPHLQHRSLLRLPLFHTGGTIFLFNFWSDNRTAFHPDDVEPLRRLLGSLVEELKANLSSIKLREPQYSSEPGLSGREKLALRPALARVRGLLEQVADTDSTVLILGETGTGKEAVADAIHELSDRRDGPFIKVNCGAIPEGLLDSELFGHEKGAFTGAVNFRPGYFEMANGGTIFLDEIGEMPLSAQTRLLRVLEGGMAHRVGGTAFPVNVRVIAASHDNLPLKVRDGRFRKDLWFRLSVFPVQIPPLRFCIEDIPPLVTRFIEAKSRRMKLPFIPKVKDSDLYALYSYAWPGNVRELEHVVERALILYRGKEHEGCLRFSTDSPLDGGCALAETRGENSEWPSLREHENRYIRDVLEHCGGKLTGEGGATEILKIQYATLKARMRKLGIPEKGRGKREKETAQQVDQNFLYGLTLPSESTESSGGPD